MAVARNLVVRVGGDVSGLQKSLNQAQKSLKKAGTQMKQVGQTLTRSITLPVVAAGTALGLMTMRVARAADDLNTLSAETGISVESLQRMDFAAEQLGTSLDVITGAQDRLVRSVWDAHQGNENAIRSFHELGVEIYDTNGEMRDADDIFWDVIDALREIENPLLRDGYAMQLLGRNARDLNPIINTTREEFENLKEGARNVLTQEQVDRLNDLNSRFLEVRNAVKGLAGIIALELEPIMRRLFDLILKEGGILDKLEHQLRRIIDAFKNLSPEMQNFIIISGAIATALGPILTVMGYLTIKLSMLAKWLAKTTLVKKGFSAAVAAIKVPVLIAVGKIAALIAIIVGLWKTNEEFRDVVTKIWEQVKEVVSIALEAIARTIDLFSDYVSWTWDKFGDTIMAVIGRVWDFVGDKVVGTLRVISGVLDAFIGLFTADWERMWDGIKEILLGALQFKLAKIRAVFGIIFDVITGILDAIGVDWRGAWQGMSDFFVSIWDGITDAVRKAVDVIMGLIDRVLGAIGRVSDGVSAVTDAAKGVGGRIKGAASGALSSIRGAIPGLATGGIVTAPTLAVVGEGRESEAVLPLSKLNNMLSTGGGGNVIQIVLDGKVIQEYIDKGFGNKLTAWGGAV